MPYKAGSRPSRARPGAKRGRPPKAQQAAEALREAELTGEPLAETAARAGVSTSTAYAAGARAGQVAAAGGGGLPTEAEINDLADVAALQRLLAEVRARKAKLPPGSPRYAPLVTAEGQILGQLRRARPPAPMNPDELQAKLRELDAEAIQKIEQHLPEPITPAEVHAA